MAQEEDDPSQLDDPPATRRWRTPPGLRLRRRWFDANARRQTSFAAVEVMPELPDDVEVEIRPEDIEMQVFRSSGAGGQHINKTSSAVRLIHKPTGIVVSSQQERSQFQNKDNCMKQLRAKLIELKIVGAGAERSRSGRRGTPLAGVEGGIIDEALELGRAEAGAEHLVFPGTIIPANRSTR